MNNNGKRDKKKNLRTSLLGFTLTTIGLSILFNSAMGVFGAAVLAGIAVGAVNVIRIMAEGQDLTTHNRQDRSREFEEIETIGNTQADEIIAKGKDALRQIREANDEIRDPGLTKQLYEIEDRCVQIFRTVAEKPDQAYQIRKFMNYYLPTTLKIIQSYRTMQNRGISSRELSKHRATLSRGLEMIKTACQQQLDNMYRDTMLDVSTDIDVLEQMLKRDGFSEGDLSAPSIATQEAARTAAAAQLAGREIPILDISEPDEPAGTAPHASLQQHTD